MQHIWTHGVEVLVMVNLFYILGVETCFLFEVQEDCPRVSLVHLTVQTVLHGYLFFLASVLCLFIVHLQMYQLLQGILLLVFL